MKSIELYIFSFVLLCLSSLSMRAQQIDTSYRVFLDKYAAKDSSGLFSGFSRVVVDSTIFIFKGRAFATELPLDFFYLESEDITPGAYQNRQSTILAYLENRVYYIGKEEGMQERTTGSRSHRARIEGHIISPEKRDSMLVDVTVALDGNLGVRTISNKEGYYQMDLPLGENTLLVSQLNSQPLKLKLYVYGDGVMDIMLKDTREELDMVVVTAEQRRQIMRSELGLEVISIEKMKYVPVSFGDPDILSIIKTLPGVRSTGEVSSGFNVRGGATDQNLILYNDGIIYNPSHLFGFFSSFNSDILSDVELYKSSIPAYFGGRISSVLDIKTRIGNKNEYRGSTSIGLISQKIHAEGPIIKEKTSFIVGGRVSYSDWLFNNWVKDIIGNFGSKEFRYTEGVPSFYDISGGVHHKINEKHSLSGFFNYSYDSWIMNSNMGFKYRNINFSGKWNGEIFKKRNIELIAGYDTYKYTFQENYNNTTSVFWGQYLLERENNQGYIKVNTTDRINDKHKIVYGVNSIYYDFLPGNLIPFIGMSIKPKRLANVNSLETALFITDEWKVSDELTLDLGTRMSTYFTDGKGYFNPEIRLSWRYLFSPTLSIKAGFNSLTQYVHMLSNSNIMSPQDLWILSNKNILPQKGWQVATGIYSILFDNQVNASIEIYYKSLRDLPDYDAGAILLMVDNIEDYLIRTKGRAYGVELLLKKEKGRLTGWGSYSYSRSQLREDSGRGREAINGGKWYNASYDMPNEVKLFVNYRMSYKYSISANIEYRTGKPMTVPLSYFDYAGIKLYDYSERNRYRIPDYFRTDIALIIDPGPNLKQNVHLTFTIGVYNITGRKNPFSMYFQEDKVYMLSIMATQIPYASINIKFK